MEPTETPASNSESSGWGSPSSSTTGGWGPLTTVINPTTVINITVANPNTTENGAAAFNTTNCATLDLFIKLVRGCKEEFIEEKFIPAWKEGAERLVKMICQTRDPRDGKGERDISYVLLKLLKKFKPLTYQKNIFRIASEYGRYDDLLELAKIPLEPANFELKLFAEQLGKDLTEEHPSLAGKWAPREHSGTPQYKELVNIMFPNDRHKHRRYRVEILKPISEKIKILETAMCANKWEEIDFEKVPSQAMLLYGRKQVRKYIPKSEEVKKKEGTFLRHQETRFKEYQAKVAEGKAKINTTGIQPHQLVTKYINNGEPTIDETIEAQWKTMVDKLRETVHLNAISVVDVSGSMTEACNSKATTRPIDVAVSLGLITSELAEEPFKNKVITFSSNPYFHNISGTTLLERVNCIQRAHWEGSTNLEATFDLILSIATEQTVPKMLFIFTDMQFDQCVFQPEETLFENAKRKFASKRIPMPKVVFWNLRPSETHNGFPVQVSTNGVAYISGFSAVLLKTFMLGVPFDPLSILNAMLEKYVVEVDPGEL